MTKYSCFSRTHSHGAYWSRRKLWLGFSPISCTYVYICVRGRVRCRGKGGVSFNPYKEMNFLSQENSQVELISNMSGGNLESLKNGLNQEEFLETAGSVWSLGANSEIRELFASNSSFSPFSLQLFIEFLPSIRHFAKPFMYMISFNFHAS